MSTTSPAVVSRLTVVAFSTTPLCGPQPDAAGPRHDVHDDDAGVQRIWLIATAGRGQRTSAAPSRAWPMPTPRKRATVYDAPEVYPA